MKKSVVSLMLITSLALAACGVEQNVPSVSSQNTTQTNSNVVEEKEIKTPNEIYDEFVEKVKAEIVKDEINLEIDGVNIGDVFIYEKQNPVLGYCKADINNDGVLDLLFCENTYDVEGEEGNLYSVVYDAYTVEDGELIQLLDGWARNRFQICEDGTVVKISSGGAAYTYYHLYELTGKEMKFKKEYFTDYVDRDNDKIGWFVSDTDPNADATEDNMISDEEANDFINGLKFVKYELTPFTEE